MKTFNYIALGLALGAFATACDDNDQPSFSDGDAFVSFSSDAVTISETADDATEISLTLASVAGISSTVYVDVVSEDGYDAIEGTDFEFVGSKELSFDSDNRTLSVKIKAIPDGIFTGDKQFKLAITDADVDLGYESECVVTIADAEHPLQSILHTYHASGTDYWGEYYDYWEITFSKDAEDVSKVWIANLDPYFAAYGYTGDIYGTVDDDLTTISIPVGQSYNYSDLTFEGFSSPDPDDENTYRLQSGENIEITIADGGKTLTIPNSFGIYNDSGWWDLMYGNITLTY